MNESQSRIAEKLRHLAANDIAWGPAVPIPEIALMVRRDDPHRPIPPEVRREAIRNEHEKRARQQRQEQERRAGERRDQDAEILRNLGLEVRPDPDGVRSDRTTEPKRSIYFTGPETASVRQARSGHWGLLVAEQPVSSAQVMHEMLRTDLISNPSPEREEVYRNLGLMGADPWKGPASS
jgi:hypothetical protein